MGKTVHKTCIVNIQKLCKRHKFCMCMFVCEETMKKDEQLAAMLGFKGIFFLMFQYLYVITPFLYVIYIWLVERGGA